MKNILLILCLIFSVFQIFGQKIKVLTNHIGYEPNGIKEAVVESYKGDEIKNCSIIFYNNNKKAADAKAIKVGKIDHWKNWYFWKVDFSSVNEEGEYYIECKTNRGPVRSFPFLIQKNILERHTISDVISYFKEQRSVGQNEKADRKMTFAEGRNDTVDVHGGWQDATGDYGKHLSHLSFSNYFIPQQIPMVEYSLCKSYEMLTKRNDENFNQIKKRMIDEILYGADYLVRIKDPKGSFYRSISAPGPDKLPGDRRITSAMTGFGIKKSANDTIAPGDVANSMYKNLNYEVSFRGGGGIAIAYLAMASQLDVFGDFSSEKYLKTAEDAFKYLELHNLEIISDSKNNIIDDYCTLSAAVELFKATKKKEYKNAADKMADNLWARLTTWKNYSNFWRADDGDRPFFHAVDEGFPVASLIYYLDICDNNTRQKVLNVIKKSLEFDLSITSEVPNAFGYARQLVQHKDGKRNSSFFYPHDTETEPWWQGEDARLASLASAARLAIPFYKTDKNFVKKLGKYADDQLNWILGLNPFDVCMLYGKGRNNPEYMFFGSWQYTCMPGGISNGITSGLNDEHDIDFNIPYSVTGKDYDWRWTEQWLPHDSWFLMAVSAGK
jgi:Glycosyl hydrolase family 9/Cellulase N-terminal ig-like domain